MKIDIKDTEKSTKEITIELPAEQFQKHLEAASVLLSKKHAIKGFRPGNAPFHIVEENVGTEALYREAAIVAIEATYSKMLETHNIEVVGEPRFDIIKIAKSNPFIYKAQITVMPEIELADYKAIAHAINEEKNEDLEVADAEVTQALEWLRESRRPQGEDGKADGEPRVIDDAFAKSIGKFETLEDLKKNIREGIRQEKETQNKEKRRSKITKAIADKVKLEIPEILLRRQIDELKQEFDANLAQMNMARADYLKAAKKEEKDIEQEFETLAHERVSVGLVLREIARREHINASEEEITEEANKFLRRFESVEEAERVIDPARLRNYTKGVIENEKVFKLLETL